MRKQIQSIIIVTLTLNSALVLAQERNKDTISTDVIQVVKPYTPSISDAFKVKEILTTQVDTFKKDMTA